MSKACKPTHSSPTQVLSSTAEEADTTPTLSEYYPYQETKDVEVILRQTSISPGLMLFFTQVLTIWLWNAWEKYGPERDMYVLESEIWVQIPAAPLKSCMTLASEISFLSVSVFIFRTA